MHAGSNLNSIFWSSRAVSPVFFTSRSSLKRKFFSGPLASFGWMCDGTVDLIVWVRKDGTRMLVATVARLS